MDETAEEFLRKLLGDTIVDTQKKIEKVAGYALEPRLQTPFVTFINWTNSRPDFINRWRSEPEAEQKRYVKMMNGLESARNATAACAYHLENIAAMEKQIEEILSNDNLRKLVPKGTTVAMSGIDRMHFEYHAFVTTFRRSLDYLAYGLSTFFNGTQIHSFNSFVKKIGNCRPASVGIALQQVSNSHAQNFEFVLGTERGQSLCDRITHREFVQSGVINIFHNSAQILGGGEGLKPSSNKKLSSTLQNRLTKLHHFQNDILQQFEASVKQWENGA